MHAIVLAGGFGTRLRSAVSDVPKPLAPIGGKPFLAYLLGSLIRQGVTGFTLSVHHEWEKIRDYFDANPPGVPIGYAVEKEPLGTGGAMAFALRTHAGDSPVMVLNGDSYVTFDFARLVTLHRERATRLSIVLRQVEDTGRYGRVELDRATIVTFGQGGIAEPGLINAGVYVMDPALFTGEALPAAFSFEKDFLPPRLESLRPQGFPADAYFIDIGIPADYRRACAELPAILKIDPRA